MPSCGSGSLNYKQIISHFQEREHLCKLKRHISKLGLGRIWFFLPDAKYPAGLCHAKYPAGLCHALPDNPRLFLARYPAELIRHCWISGPTLTRINSLIHVFSGQILRLPAIVLGLPGGGGGGWGGKVAAHLAGRGAGTPQGPLVTGW